MGDILRDAGHKVGGIGTRIAATLKLTAKMKPQVAIVDIGLHGAGDGLATAQALKILVISLAGDPGFLVRAMALDIEPLGYIAKPCQPPDIIAALERFA